MINTELFSSFRDKSRVLIFSKTPSIAKCLVHILKFHQKKFDFILTDQSSSISNHDFIILETENTEIISEFQPNIVFISTETIAEELSLILGNIISGGVLVYPQKFENKVEITEQFFRKLFFDNFHFQEKREKLEIITEMGNIPILFKDEILSKNLKGIQLICQQFGVLNEDFYEPLMSFE